MNFDFILKHISIPVYLLIDEYKNLNILNNLKNKILKHPVSELSYKTNVKGKFTGFQSLIDDEDLHIFLKDIHKQINFIYKNNFQIKDAWGNICKKNEEVIEHHHGSTSAFCGILYLSEGGPGTFFPEFNITVEEKFGKFVLFHPSVLHSVKKIDKEIERITIAFNMNEIKDWDNTTNIKWVNKNDI
jgi:hypothetical protein